jgi:hypothetical protein
LLGRDVRSGNGGLVAWLKAPVFLWPRLPSRQNEAPKKAADTTLAEQRGAPFLSIDLDSRTGSWIRKRRVAFGLETQ